MSIRSAIKSSRFRVKARGRPSPFCTQFAAAWRSGCRFHAQGVLVRLLPSAGLRYGRTCRRCSATLAPLALGAHRRHGDHSRTSCTDERRSREGNSHFETAAGFTGRSEIPNDLASEVFAEHHPHHIPVLDTRHVSVPALLNDHPSRPVAWITFEKPLHCSRANFRPHGQLAVAEVFEVA